MSYSFAIEGQSAIAAARRAVGSVAMSAGLPEPSLGRVALVVTELATNLLKHAGTGQLIFGLFEDETGQGLEILSLDNGPGMTDVGACLADGFSTAHSAGNGLGAVRRLSDQFDICSWPGRGTVVLARLLAKPVAGAAGRTADYGALALPKAGEDVSGDAWAVGGPPGRRTLMLADGLGHGPEAAQAAVEAVRVFRSNESAPPEAILQRMHLALRCTRGAAASVAALDPALGVVSFAGIGNVAGAAVGHGAQRRMVSHNGTLGHNVRKVQAFDYPLSGSLVILNSDGVSNSWSLDAYPGLSEAHPTLVAGVLLRDFARGRDDATVLVCRSRPE